MSTDRAVTKDLVETLEDGKNGFAKAAERLEGDNNPDLASSFRQYSEQRAQFSDELTELAKDYGDDVEDSGTFKASVHRAWLSVKDALSGADPSGVLDVAEQGEDHAVKQYEKALEADISPALRAVVARQYSAVKGTHDAVRSMRDSHKD